MVITLSGPIRTKLFIMVLADWARTFSEKAMGH